MKRLHLLNYNINSTYIQSLLIDSLRVSFLCIFRYLVLLFIVSGIQITDAGSPLRSLRCAHPSPCSFRRPSLLLRSFQCLCFLFRAATGFELEFIRNVTSGPLLTVSGTYCNVELVRREARRSEHPSFFILFPIQTFVFP